MEIAECYCITLIQ